MDTREAISIAQRYVEGVSKKFQVENAILFGSFAKGNHRPDSDIDLAIVFAKVDDLIDVQIELMCMRDNDALLIEPHPFNASDFNRNDPMVAEILKTGIDISFKVA